jgi:hypothetical protein
MTENRAYVLELLRRQAAWQAAQAQLSWAEKIKLAEAVRESIAILRLKPTAGEMGSDSI